MKDENYYKSLIGQEFMNESGEVLELIAYLAPANEPVVFNYLGMTVCYEPNVANKNLTLIDPKPETTDIAGWWQVAGESANKDVLLMGAVHETKDAAVSDSQKNIHFRRTGIMQVGTTIVEWV
jgi:hypothetical protein